MQNLPFLCHCEAAERPWQSLSRRYGIPWRSTVAENDRIPKFRIVTERHHHSASPEAPFHAGERLHFPCFSIFHTIKGRISPRCPAASRSRMPSRSVKDCRVGRKKWALLAITDLIGVAGKRNSFQNETLEKRCGAPPRKNDRIKQKRPFPKQKRFKFVSLRGAQRRGNLKAEGMASRSEARCPRETDFKHFGNKNGRFYCKTFHFCVIARPQSGRGNL